MCEYCVIEEWQKDNPPPVVPDSTWNVRFLDVVHASSPAGARGQQYDKRYIDVRLVAPNRFVAERLAWDLLKEQIGRTPFKDDFVLMGAAEIQHRVDSDGWVWAAWDSYTIQVKEGSGPCWHCGMETKWVEINFQAWLCSPACNEAKWKEFAEASARHGN